MRYPLRSVSDSSPSTPRRSFAPPPIPAAQRWLVVQTCAAVAATAGAIGGLASWALWPMGLTVALAVGPLWLAARERPRPDWWAFLPVACFFAYVGVQLLNPSHVPVAGGGWRPREDWIRWLPTTMDREVTVRAALPWIFALFQAGVLGAMLRSRRAVRALALGLAGVVGVFAFVGAVFWFGGSKLLLGVLAVPGGQFFSTFVYKNHWSAFALLGACSAAGLGFSAWARIGGGGDARRERTVRLFAFCALILILLTPALPVSRSGTVLAALVALVVSVAVLIRLMRGASGGGRRALLLGAAGLAGIVLVLGRVAWLSQGSLEEGWRRSLREWQRVEEKGEWNTRVYLIRDTRTMVQVRPWFGWGAGSFEAVFPLYQGSYGRNRKGERTVRFDHAHSDWMELAAEYGLVGLGLLAGSALAGLWRALRAGIVWGRWTLFGLAIVAVYAVAEFPFHNPAVLLLWCVLLAAAGTPREKRGPEAMAGAPGR